MRMFLRRSADLKKQILTFFNAQHLRCYSSMVTFTMYGVRFERFVRTLYGSVA